MDAKITKARLGNYLSYDWIKILVILAVAIGVLCVFFTTISTKPRDDQEFELYCYTGLSAGTDSSRFDRVLEEGDPFSYDILVTTFESFDTFDTYSSTAYAARRAAGQGEAMFVSSEDYIEKDADGVEHEKNRLVDFLRECTSEEGLETEHINPLYDLPTYMNDCEAYLARVFGANWRTNDVPDEGAVEEIFTARNGGDKRFRSAAKREEGISLERARLIRLRSDYLVVSDLIARGIYSYTTYTSEIGKTYTVALKIDGLARLNNFVFYLKTDEEENTVRVADGINFVIFKNYQTPDDLRFESISLLRWLYEEYGA